MKRGQGLKLPRYPAMSREIGFVGWKGGAETPPRRRTGVLGGKGVPWLSHDVPFFFRELSFSEERPSTYVSRRKLHDITDKSGKDGKDRESSGFHG